MGSACNYGYGTIDPIGELSDLALERGVGLHVDGCLGGFILPWGQELGYDIPLFDFRVPGVTSISADTHKYGYGFKGSSVLAFRDIALRNSQYFFMTDWTGGKYASPGIEGSRSGGLLAATWAAMVSIGRTGYLEYAKQIFETAFAMQDAVRSHPELRIIGQPDVLLQLHERRVRHLPRQRLHADPAAGASTASSTRTRSTWRSPVRRRSPACVEAFAADLAEAVPYAVEHKDEKPASGAIYGGVEGGMTDEADDFIRAVMDRHARQAPGPAADAGLLTPSERRGGAHTAPHRALHVSRGRFEMLPREMDAVGTGAQRRPERGDLPGLVRRVAAARERLVRSTPWLPPAPRAARGSPGTPRELVAHVGDAVRVGQRGERRGRCLRSCTS